MNGPRRPRIVCLGMSAFDIAWQVESLPAGNGKTRALDLHEGGGGMAANASVAAARLGADVQFWGRGGEDTAGRATRDELARFGVDVAQFRLFEGARTSVSGVIVDRAGERLIVNFRGADLPTDTAWLPLREVHAFDAVLADPRWPEGAAALFTAARAAGKPTVLDADVSDAAVFDLLLPLTDYAVFSEPALRAYALTCAEQDAGNAAGLDLDIEAQLRQAASRGCRLAAVTRGEHGIDWLQPGIAARHHLPAFPIDAVDTTGAGDAFHGALAYALATGLDTRHAFQMSSAVAALKCLRHGGRAALPDLAATRSFLATRDSTDSTEPIKE